VDPDHQQLNADASVWVRDGLAKLEADDPCDVAAALACFERALAIRRQLPLDENPELRYDLAGTLLNQAAALVRLGGGGRASAALLAYDEALALLRQLRVAEEPRWARRLAIAYQNRGIARLSLRADAALTAMQDFIDAIAVLEDEACAPVPDRSALLATTWLTLADAQLHQRSEQAWRRAIGSAAVGQRLVAPAERDDPRAAELGIRARILCAQGTARCLAAVQSSDSFDLDDVHAATDAADDALALIAYWERQGVAAFRPWALDLFRFGRRVYGAFQPHLLDEFVADHLEALTASGDVVFAESLREIAEEG